jgi:hypothetical protein
MRETVLFASGIVASRFWDASAGAVDCVAREIFSYAMLLGRVRAAMLARKHAALNRAASVRVA